MVRGMQGTGADGVRQSGMLFLRVEILSYGRSGDFTSWLLLQLEGDIRTFQAPSRQKKKKPLGLGGFFALVKLIETNSECEFAFRIKGQ